MKIVRNDVTPQSTVCCNQCEKMVIYAIETADGERICKECAEAAIEELRNILRRSSMLYAHPLENT